MADDSGFSERMQITGALGQMATGWLWDKRSFYAGGQEYEIADPEDEGYRRGYDDEDMETIVLIRRKADGAVFQVELEPLVQRAREVKAEPAVPVAAAVQAEPEIDGQLVLPGAEVLA